MTDPTTGKANGIALPAGRWETFAVALDSEPLTPAESLALASHSPGGLCRGYSGLGAAQLASLRPGPRDAAPAHYGRFKDEVGAHRPQADSTLRVELATEEAGQ